MQTHSSRAPRTASPFAAILGMVAFLFAASSFAACARPKPFATVPPSRVEDRRIPDAARVLPPSTRPIEAVTAGNIPTPPLDEPVEGGDTERDVHPSRSEIVSGSSIVIGLTTLRGATGTSDPPIHATATLSEYGPGARLVVALDGPPARYGIEVSREPWPCARVTSSSAPLVQVGEVEVEVAGEPVVFVRVLDVSLLTSIEGDGREARSARAARSSLERFEGRVVVARRLGEPAAAACGSVRLQRGDPVASVRLW